MSENIKVLELFSGTECISNAFRNRGYDCYTVDWDEKFPSSLHCDIEFLDAQTILDNFGRPDIMFCGFDCTTFSMGGISHHRKKNHETGELDPISEFAKKADRMNIHVINDLYHVLKPKIFIVENPRAGLRKMHYMDEFKITTTTYCQYGFTYMKPTDFFSNIDLPLLPPCKNGSPCHEKAPRGSRTGLQGVVGTDKRSMYPQKLCEHIVDICDEYMRLRKYEVDEHCRNCANLYSSAECDLCENFDMYMNR